MANPSKQNGYVYPFFAYLINNVLIVYKYYKRYKWKMRVNITGKRQLGAYYIIIIVVALLK